MNWRSSPLSARTLPLLKSGSRIRPEPLIRPLFTSEPLPAITLSGDSMKIWPLLVMPGSAADHAAAEIEDGQAVNSQAVGSAGDEISAKIQRDSSAERLVQADVNRRAVDLQSAAVELNASAVVEQRADGKCSAVDSDEAQRREVPRRRQR